MYLNICVSYTAEMLLNSKNEGEKMYVENCNLAQFIPLH